MFDFAKRICRQLCCISTVSMGVITACGFLGATAYGLPANLPASGSSSVEMTSGSFQMEMMHSMQIMQENMMSPAMSGNPDRDFINMMIPHHQGAVDMAKIELKYGKNEKLRHMSEEIIKAQEKEIHEMTEILSQMGPDKSDNGSTKSLHQHP